MLDLAAAGVVARIGGISQFEGSVDISFVLAVLIEN